MSKLDALSVKRLITAARPGMTADGDGLFLRIRDTGNARWMFRYRLQGRDVWLPLGDARAMSLAIARQEKRAARVLIDQGRDPLAERRAKRAAAEKRDSFAELAERWFANEIAPRYKRPEAVRRALDKHILPKLGRKVPTEITAAACATFLDEHRHVHPALANDLLRYLKAIFSFGRRRHALTASPVGDFLSRLDAGGLERKRDRALSKNELTQFLKAMRETPEFGGTNALALKLLLALCVRKGELLAARWEEFDLAGGMPLGAVWRLPAERTKSGTSLAIPLAAPIVAWLEALRTAAGGSPWVFPARRRDPRARSEHLGIDTLNVAVGRLALDMPPFTLHDLRRTARTHLAALGVRSEVAERCLNHAVRGVEGTYNRHDYYRERREALAQWAALLVELEEGRGNVIPIGGKVAAR